jgi:hypothetical protein
MKNILTVVAVVLALAVMAPMASAENVTVFATGGITQTVKDADVYNYGVGAAFSLPRNTVTVPVEFVKSPGRDLFLAGLSVKLATPLKCVDVSVAGQLGSELIVGTSFYAREYVASSFSLNALHTFKTQRFGSFQFGPQVRYTAVRGHSELSEQLVLTKTFSFGSKAPSTSKKK